MEKQISFQGVSLNPYGDISPDGELSACLNFQSHGGALRPSRLGGTDIIVSSEAKLIYIHSTASYRHMIFYDDTTLFWAEESPEITELKTITNISGLKSVQAIGNTLSVLSNDGITYILYKESDYITLGEIPELSLSFALHGAGGFGETKTVTVETIRYADLSKDFSDNNKRIITDAAMSLANNFVSERHKQGTFVFPFLLRYALRLYNGDLIKHSVPILMSCTNERGIYAQTPLEQGRDITELQIQIIGCYYKLLYKSDLGRFILKDWSDIISSVDVFISEPIYTYYPDKLCERFAFIANGYAVCNTSADRQNFMKRSFQDIFLSNNTGYGFKKPIELPYKELAEIAKAVEQTSNFYLLTSIPCNELSVTLQNINIDSTVLGSLSFKERMTDDYDSHDKLYADIAFVYNRRLNLANIKKELFKGHELKNVLTYQDDFHDGYDIYECYIYEKVNNQDVIFKMPNFIISSKLTIDYFFFPCVNAFKAVFVKSNTVLSLELKQHPLLNGSYYCSGFKDHTFTAGSVPQPGGSMIVDLPNTIYTSQVDNPFYFPIEGVNAVGTGEIIGLSTITTALSQGQYGFFPLMILCTDGNYALEVNSDGLFGKASAMKRDVCSNPDSITQIDGAIVFVSAKGVMLADGSDIQCISAALDGSYDDLSFIVNENAQHVNAVPPVDYFQNCMIGYDYAAKRLLFLKKSKGVTQYGWQYDIDNMKWQQIDYAGALQIINVYPYSYVQQSGVVGTVVKKLELPYDYADKSDFVSGMIVTRPVKLDSLQLKSISQIRLEGSFNRLQKLYLYGSNNLRDWFLIGATAKRRLLLRGRYFKFFRIAVTSELYNSENISGCRIVYGLKPENRLR